MKALLEGLQALGFARVAAMGAVAVGLLALLAVMALRAGSNDQMALLYGDLDLREAGQVVEQLNRKHIPYRIAGGGNQILVPAEQVPEARLALAREGLPTGGSIGYELFDRGDGFAFTDFQQKINETRALEGEISRTIRAIRGVRLARVHLVLPRREPFSRDRQDAQASVLLTMAGVQRLDREGTQAILNLVSAAVPGLRPQNISIVDSRGGLLARAGEPVGQVAAAMSADELRRATELRLSRAVEEMLERSLGPGRVRAEAAVRMNFDKVNETQERYDPDGQVTRSTQSVTSNSKTTEQNGAVSVQNNLPNAEAGAPGGGTQEGKQEETTNYEIGRTVRTLIREQPQLDRISLAVMVDGIELLAADGKRTWQPRAPEELDRIATLVKTSIGFDEKRGDKVDIVSMRFVGDEPTPVDPPGLLGLKLEKTDIVRLAQTGLFGVIGLLALLLVLRPMVNRLISLAPGGILLGEGIASLAGANGAPMAGVIGQGPAAAGTGAFPGVAFAGGSTALLEDESMVNVAQIEGQMRASSLRKLSELVDKHPDETLTIMRGWMAQDNGRTRQVGHGPQHQGHAKSGDSDADFRRRSLHPPIRDDARGRDQGNLRRNGAAWRRPGRNGGADLRRLHRLYRQRRRPRRQFRKHRDPANEDAAARSRVADHGRNPWSGRADDVGQAGQRQ
jgi:flagellar M-ring protein FliF